MMQGCFTMLPSKYDIYCIPNILSMHGISLNSQRKMLNYNTNPYMGNEGYVVGSTGNEKKHFHFTFFYPSYLSQ